MTDHYVIIIGSGAGGGCLAHDPDCKAREVDDLCVVGTSFFPSIGAVNPALTAMANTKRVGEQLIDRIR